VGLVPLRDGKKRESKTMELGTKNSDAPVTFQRSRPGYFDGQSSSSDWMEWSGRKVDPASRWVCWVDQRLELSRKMALGRLMALVWMQHVA
jgi:hypothetical protein